MSKKRRYRKEERDPETDELISAVEGEYDYYDYFNAILEAVEDIQSRVKDIEESMKK